MRIHESPYNLCITKFSTSIKLFSLLGQQAVKYLEIYIDETLKWTKYIHKKFQQKIVGKTCSNKKLLTSKVVKIKPKRSHTGLVEQWAYLLRQLASSRF